ncbi:MAG: hypothetical protein H0U64_07855 [Gemmatimonadaceae bacterium]|nr:hypothetical protein [Gemmatimonadaceae bacterium]
MRQTGNTDVLIDELLPEFEFSERHQTRIRGLVPEVYDAITRVDFSRIRGIRILLIIRALPNMFFSPSRKRSPVRLTLRDAEKFGFFIAAECPPVELVIVLQGKFWSVRPGTECVSREALDNPLPPGCARGAWNFTVRPVSATHVLLRTETRVHCSDSASHWKFRFYWMLVRPGSGLIRRMMLRAIRDEVEQAIR